MHEISKSGARGRADVLANAADWALFIDIDGTLLDMAPRPDAAVVPAGLVETLGGLVQRLGGAVALVTGRRVADADRFFAPLRLVASGVHGAEARTVPGGATEFLVAPVPRRLLEAVHYRDAPQALPTIERELWRIVGAWAGYTLRSGRKVLELVPAAHSKGTGLGALMRLPAFSGRRPVMIGDDHGDEPAMHLAERMGGLALQVAGEHFDRRAADFDSAASVRAWLSLLADPARRDVA